MSIEDNIDTTYISTISYCSQSSTMYIDLGIPNKKVEGIDLIGSYCSNVPHLLEKVYKIDNMALSSNQQIF